MLVKEIHGVLEPPGAMLEGMVVREVHDVEPGVAEPFDALGCSPEVIILESGGLRRRFQEHVLQVAEQDVCPGEEGGDPLEDEGTPLTLDGGADAVAEADGVLAE